MMARTSQIILAIVAGVLFSFGISISHATAQAVGTSHAVTVSLSTQAHTPKRWTAMRWAESQAGKHYVYGAAGPSTYDCSGLVMRAYAHAGISLPHNVSSMVHSGRLIRTSHPHWGDLAVFGGNTHIELFDYWRRGGFESFGAHSSAHPIIGWRANIHPYYASVAYYTVSGAN